SILVTASDTFTKWVEDRVVYREDASSVTEAVVRMLTSLGLQSYIKTDRGSVLGYYVMQQLAQRLGAAKPGAASFTPQEE
ncbi:hypothetical protein Pmar_PMAR008059, partial [Perkinsus marinus ATCC 50983]